MTNFKTDQAALQRALAAATAEREREMEKLLALAEGHTSASDWSRRAEAALVIAVVVLLAALVVWGALR